MPYKHTDFHIPKCKDKRRKLTDDQKEEIRLLAIDHSQRQLARIFQVSRRLIQFILDSNKHEANLLRREERGGTKQYYDKDKNKEYMKKHRKLKQELYKQGILLLTKNTEE